MGGVSVVFWIHFVNFLFPPSSFPFSGRTLTFKTFFIWVIVSVFQGSVIMYGALLLFENDLIHIVSITFTGKLIVIVDSSYH